MVPATTLPVKPFDKVAPEVVHWPLVPTVVVASKVLEELYSLMVAPTGPVPVTGLPIAIKPVVLFTVIAGAGVTHMATVWAVLFAIQ